MDAGWASVGALPLVRSEPPKARLSLVRASSLTAGLAGHFRGFLEASHSALPRGHGVAAEHASHLLDKLKGRVVTHLGHDNARCGPDRSVDGVLVQTKYCASGRNCIAECFDETGFRYLLPNGRPMQIEVPKDLYPSAVQAMQSRIARGQVPGVFNPADAAKIVRRGLLTYDQARHLGRAGTYESVLFDAATSLRATAAPAALASGLGFLRSAYAGQDLSVSLREAAQTGARTGATTYVSHIMTKQLARTAMDGMLTPASNWIVQRCGPGMTMALAKATGRSFLRGGAAAGHVAKVLRGNVVSAAATGALLSTIDLCRIGAGRVTAREGVKSIIQTNAGVAGGTAGWAAGAAAGACLGSVVPVFGTGACALVGGLAGSYGGSALGTEASTAVLRVMIREKAAGLYVSEEDNFVLPLPRGR